MMMKIVTIYDKKAEAYALPMFFQSLGQAERSFGDIINDKQQPIGQHPADYIMFAIGEWDELKGVISVFAVQINVAEGIHLLKKEKI